jgi:hypothetical protein
MPTKNEISEFSEMIEIIAVTKNIPRMDAILYHCEQTGMELEICASLISSALKAKIREEAENLNLLRSKSKLPL